MNKWILTIVIFLLIAVGYWGFYVKKDFQSDGLKETYSDSSGAFSLRYPSGFVVDDKYKYEGLGPDKNILGVRFAVDPVLARGTNLSSDSFISIERMPVATECSASLFLYEKPKENKITDEGVDYSVATSSGAGAGNFYEETIYALPQGNTCMGIRYFIHSTNIGNYPVGAVKEFNRTALMLQFDAIRHSLIFNP